MTQVMTSVAAWAPPWLPSLPEVQAESPQAPNTPIYDSVELSLKSLYAGRVGAINALDDMGFQSSTGGQFSAKRWELKLNGLHQRGLITKTGLNAARKTALFAGGISVVKNLASLANGNINMVRATGNVSSDIATGTISGFVAGGTAAIGAHSFANAGKFMAGAIGTIAGAIGFVAADFLLEKIGLKDYLSDSVTSALEGMSGISHLPVQL